MERIIDSMLIDMCITENSMIDMIDQVCDIGLITEASNTTDVDDIEAASQSNFIKKAGEKISKFIKYIIEQLKKFFGMMRTKYHDLVHRIQFNKWVNEAKKLNYSNEERVDLDDLPRVEKITRKYMELYEKYAKEVVTKYTNMKLNSDELETIEAEIDKINEKRDREIDGVKKISVPFTESVRIVEKYSEMLHQDRTERRIESEFYTYSQQLERMLHNAHIDKMRMNTKLPTAINCNWYA